MSIVRALQAIVGKEAVYDDPADCFAYGYDNSLAHATPQAVVFPSTHEQVQAIVQACHDANIALVARGRGSGTVGGCVPITHGVVISFERMSRVIDFQPENRFIIVQPGISNGDLQAIVAEKGFFWAPDPSSSAYATVGGNLAYNSSGPRAIKYGTPRENTLGLKAVIGSGETITTGVKTTKGVVGYDLTRLLIGSEGTLGIITEATLKLTPLPQSKRTLALHFDSVESAAAAVCRTMAQSALPCALEFMDTRSLEMIKDYSDVDIPATTRALLILEVDGHEASVDESVQHILAACDVSGLLNAHVAETADEVKQIWAMRKALSPSLKKVAPKKINEDVVVPVSQIPTLIDRLHALSQEHHIPIVTFGHIGNGNLHVNLMIDPENAQQTQAATPCLEAVFQSVLALGGTLSGEHGVGMAKQAYIADEIDAPTLALMRNIKTLFDPKHILNPGKVFPANQVDAPHYEHIH